MKDYTKDYDSIEKSLPKDPDAYIVPDIDEEIFTKVFGKDAETFFEENLSREDIINLALHPDILIEYKPDKNENRRFMEAMDVDDIVHDILGEGFDTSVLINAIKDVLRAKGGER